MSKKKLIFLLILGIVLRLLVLWLLPSSLADDAIAYKEIALNLVREEKFYNSEGLAYRPPLQSFFMATAYKIFGINDLWPSLIQVSLSVLTAFLIFKITNQYSKKDAPLAFILTVLSFDLILFSPLLMVETLFLFLIVFGFWLIFSKRTNFQLAGFIWGLSVLAKPTFLPLWLCLMICLLKKQEAKTSLWVKAVFLLLLPPLLWSTRNYLTLKKPVFVSTNGGLNLYIGSNPYSLGTYDKETEKILFLFEDKSETEKNSLYLKAAKDFMVNNPLRFLANLLRKPFYLMATFGGSAEGLVVRAIKTGDRGARNLLRIAFSFGQLISYWLTLGFGLYFMIFNFGKIRRSRLLSSVLFFAVGYVLLLLPFFTFPRFRIPLLFPLIVFASLGIRDFLKKGNHRKLALSFSFLVLLTIRDWFKIGKAMFAILKKVFFWQPINSEVGSWLYFFTNPFLWLVVFGLLIWFLFKKKYQSFFSLIIIIALSWPLEFLFKRFSPWQRPFLELGKTPPPWIVGYSNGSFLSGHAMRSAIVLSFLFEQNRKAFWFLLPLLGLTLLGRIVFGLHYPIDILAGLVVGYLSVKAIKYSVFRKKK